MIQSIKMAGKRAPVSKKPMPCFLSVLLMPEYLADLNLKTNNPEISKITPMHIIIVVPLAFSSKRMAKTGAIAVVTDETAPENPIPSDSRESGVV